MHAVSAQFRREQQAAWGAGFHAEPTALALFHVDKHFSVWCVGHDSRRFHCWLQLWMVQPLSPFAVVVQFIPKFRVRNLNQRLGPLPDGFAVKISHTEFRGDVMHQPATGYYTGSRSKGWHDTGNLAIARR